MPKKQKEESESEEYSQEESEEEEKVEIKKPKVERLDKMKNLKKIVINISMTQYSVVAEAAEELGWKLQYSSERGDWDVFWTDFHIEPEVLIKMHLFQKINHFPGIHTLARKNLLGLNLMAMRERFPEEYDFFPLTWMLPQQYVEFRTHFESKPRGKARTYIVKPEADCQGRGIFLTRRLNSIENGKHYVVQRYVARPYLIDGLKFDMRIYVLLGSVNPLRVYLYEEGLARFATEPYIEPTSGNLEKQYMHLTNYAINKRNPKFVFNNNSANMGFGHKRSLSCVYRQLEKKGVDVEALKGRIRDLIIKTVVTGQPLMAHQYRCSQPEDYSGNMCFHVLGFDVMLRNTGEPVLIEVNHTPSFSADTPLDFKIKKALIRDTLLLMNVNLKKKNELYARSLELNQNRLLTGKRNILEGPERAQLIEQQQAERELFEQKHLGGFECIYPSKDPQRMHVYQQLIEHATVRQFDENAVSRSKLLEKEAKRLAREEYKELKKNRQQQKTQKHNNKEQQDSIVQVDKNRENLENEKGVSNRGAQLPKKLIESAQVTDKKSNQKSTASTCKDLQGESRKQPQRKKTFDNFEVPKKSLSIAEYPEINQYYLNLKQNEQISEGRGGDKSQSRKQTISNSPSIKRLQQSENVRGQQGGKPQSQKDSELQKIASQKDAKESKVVHNVQPSERNRKKAISSSLTRSLVPGQSPQKASTELPNIMLGSAALVEQASSNHNAHGSNLIRNPNGAKMFSKDGRRLTRCSKTNNQNPIVLKSGPKQTYPPPSSKLYHNFESKQKNMQQQRSSSSKVSNSTDARQRYNEIAKSVGTGNFDRKSTLLTEAGLGNNIDLDTLNSQNNSAVYQGVKRSSGNFSGLMPRKRKDPDIVASSIKKMEKQRNDSEKTKFQRAEPWKGAKISYSPLEPSHSNGDCGSGLLQQNNGEFVMPKIYCMNFDSEKLGIEYSRVPVYKKMPSDKN